eukprot:TRINITY_DN3522_c0_g2_i1.p1 TRINITY_DN3522_c0_g2~~TRINITY_DN3522_c0_g2_i1.p1  ORF type:complete len:537 (-),score=82.12 TRINITY_DN3522_c0_g2_i1:769-2379(-)
MSISLETIKRLPKAELHRHLDGSVRISTIIELANEQNIQLPTTDPEELKKLVTVDENCQSLVQYLRGFDITLLVLQKSYAITRAMYEVCEDAMKDGVRYLEVRFSPILHVREGLSLSGVMEAICEGQSMAEYAFPIKVVIIVCAMRQLSPEITKDLADIAWRYKGKGVRGFDLAGPEHGFSAKIHRDAFDLIRKHCVNCTIHSGEAAGWESVQHSIQYCGAHRLGHGVRLQENPQLVRYVINQRIPLECCVTSNLHTKAITDLKSHPIRKYFDQGVVVVPCTDNPTVSGVTLSGEYHLIQQLFGFNVEEILRMIDYGFSVGFMDITSKSRMRAEVLKECVVILQQAGHDVTPIIKNKQYYNWIGVDLNAISTPNLTRRYGSLHFDPKFTLDILKNLPKTDLHCKFDTSVTVDFVYDELDEDDRIFLKQRYHIEYQSKEELSIILSRKTPTNNGDDEAKVPKRIIGRCLQTVPQILRALDLIYERAKADNVRYMELSVRPQTHAKGELTAEEALAAILKGIDARNNDYVKDKVCIGK